MTIGEIILLFMVLCFLLYSVLESHCFGDLKDRYNSLIDKYNNLLHEHDRDKEH